jgi:hypothetical protein
VITPVAGIQHLVSLVDGIAGIRSHLPPLVAAVTSADECETARKSLDGYHQRLSVDNRYSLIPHALPTAHRCGHNPNAQGVLNQLSQGFTVNGKTGRFTVTEKDHKDPTSDRIRILEAKPNILSRRVAPLNPPNTLM